MNTTTVKTKIRKIESELSLLKRTLLREPNFDIDEKNWKKIEPTVRQIRKSNVAAHKQK
ncbi:MAG: hypothetical protein QF747_02075 [Patescibacteria group bacterium]|jgi:hypothetical protein|nr:hypothetical protein [Patescibacteria group bacterium]|tara:strand:- start:12359 stop:12535 length:177 start_codon:yes stop_codon:yes gene_type:complete